MPDASTHPHTRLQGDAATDHTSDLLTLPSQASKDIHPIFESPDDVGADLSPSPSVKARKTTVNELPHRPNTINALYRNAVPPKISISDALEYGRLEHSPSMHQRPLDLAHSHDAPPGPQIYRNKYSIGEEQRWQEAGQNGRKAASTKEIIEEVKQRRQRIEARERHPGRLKPSMLPNMKTLTLTDVPSTTRRQDFIDSLITFIQECAEEEELATLEDLEWQESDGRFPRKEMSSCGIFKLQRLVLEMSSASDPILPPLSPREKRQSFTKSSTEDPDSEMFMEASESDFSFFGEDDGGLLVSEGRIDAPIVLDDGLVFMGTSTEGRRPVDVVSELSSFRKGRRTAYKAAARGGKCETDRALLGHWVGEVKVVKNYAVVSPS